MTRSRCANCRFFDDLGAARLGICRRRPPAVLAVTAWVDGDEVLDAATCWTHVDPQGWCGEYEPDSQKRQEGR